SSGTSRGVEETVRDPTPAAAAAALGADFATVLARSGGALAAGAASFFSTGLAGVDFVCPTGGAGVAGGFAGTDAARGEDADGLGASGFGALAFTNFDCATALTWFETAGVFGASGFFATTDLDSLHFSSSSSSSLPVWKRSAGSFASAFMI